MNILAIFLSNKLSDNKTANNVDINKVIGNSFFTVLFFTCNVWTQAAVPNINKIFKILLPTTFPSTISPLPEINDFTLTANSGALVPNATIVNPCNLYPHMNDWEKKVRSFKVDTTILAGKIRIVKVKTDYVGIISCT